MEKIIKKVTLIIESESVDGDRMEKDEFELAPISSEGFDSLLRSGVVKLDEDAKVRNFADPPLAPEPGSRKRPVPLAIMQRKVPNEIVPDHVESFRLSPLVEFGLSLYVPASGGVRHHSSGTTKDVRSGWGTLRDRSPLGEVSARPGMNYPNTDEK